MLISVTSATIHEVRRIKSAQNLAGGTFLRISILGGGCSGINYSLTFDTEFDPVIDTQYVFDDLTLTTQKKFDPHFDGTEIDFVESPTGSGFVVENPNFPKFAGCAYCGH